MLIQPLNFTENTLTMQHTHVNSAKGVNFRQPDTMGSRASCIGVCDTWQHLSGTKTRAANPRMHSDLFFSNLIFLYLSFVEVFMVAAKEGCMLADFSWSHHFLVG